MQRVHLINQNESIEKVSVIYGIDSNKIKLSNKKINGSSYFSLSGYDDGIYLLENYHAPFVFTVKNESHNELVSAGYDLKTAQISEDDVLLLQLAQGQKHIVRPLEKLEHIANFYHTPKSEIIKRNHLKTEKLYIGQILWI